MTIISDSILTENAGVSFRKAYIVSQEKDIFFITTKTTTSDNSKIDISKTEISLNTTFDTLGFGTSIGTAQFSTIYKRVNN